MKTFTKLLQPLLIGLLLVSCTQKNEETASSSCSSATIGMSSSTVTTSSNNTIPVYVADSATTGIIHYSNEPLVSVTICKPNHTSTSECQTISNILLDTGSFGLRIFSTAINSNTQLTQATTSLAGSTYNLAQCAVFGTGVTWGGVSLADVQLGNLTATNIPIQLINSGFVSIPSGCSSAGHVYTDPCDAGFNGILGIGMFAKDCGADCNSPNGNVNPGNYFACSASDCANACAVSNSSCKNSGGTTVGCVTPSGGTQAICMMQVTTANQIANPIASFSSSTYNNGLSITLPSIAVTGASQISGTMTMGIGAGAGNTPSSSIVAYGADPNGQIDGKISDFRTKFFGTTYGTSAATPALLDSGSNGLFFPTPSGLSLCSDNSGFFCVASPATSVTFNAGNGNPTLLDYTGTTSLVTSFTIYDAVALRSSGHTAFPSLGGSLSGSFIWGLPFFYGRTVYVGIDGQSATFNAGSATGPYWAF